MCGSHSWVNTMLCSLKHGVPASTVRSDASKQGLRQMLLPCLSRLSANLSRLRLLWPGHICGFQNLAGDPCTSRISCLFTVKLNKPHFWVANRKLDFYCQCARRVSAREVLAAPLRRRTSYQRRPIRDCSDRIYLFMALSLPPITVEVNASTSEFGECHEYSLDRDKLPPTSALPFISYSMTVLVPQFLPLKMKKLSGPPEEWLPEV